MVDLACRLIGQLVPTGSLQLPDGSVGIAHGIEQ